MSKLAMNLNKRIKQAVKNNKTLVAWFRKHGYFVLVGSWQCDACAEEMIIASQSVGYSGTDIPPWGNGKCALRFKKNGVHIAACKCGWRKTLKDKALFTPKETIKCKVRGCPSTLTKTDTDGLCVKCRNEIAGGGNPARYARYCTLKPKHGCMHYMQGSDADCVRLKCDKYDPIGAAMHSKLKICNRKNCNNPVPPGRKAVCFVCKPAPAKAAKPPIRM